MREFYAAKREYLETPRKKLASGGRGKGPKTAIWQPHHNCKIGGSAPYNAQRPVTMDKEFCGHSPVANDDNPLPSPSVFFQVPPS